MRYFILTLGLAAASVQAAPLASPVDNPPDLTREQIRQAAASEKSKGKAQTAPHNIEMSEAELLAQPELLRRLLDAAVETQNTEDIAFLLAYYRRLPEESQDKVLLDYAESLILRGRGDYTGAEKRQRALLAVHPDYAPIRLQLAHTLSGNGKQREAAQEVASLRQTPDLPPQVGVYLNRFDDYLKRERAWKFDAGLSYLQDSNVGRTPEQRTYGNWTFSEPKAAHGIAYDVSAQKTVPLKNHWAARVQASAGGKFYWDAHDYDDLIARAETGAVWRDARQEVSLNPFYEKRWYGTEPYSAQSGAALRYSRVLSPKFQLYAAWQSGYKKHDERIFLDGAAHSLSLTLMHRTKPNQTLLYGLDGGSDHARDLSEANRRYGLRAGWLQDWGKGQQLSTALHFSVQRRHYRAPDFFNIQRQDTEYAARASVSHKQLSWQGFTPRLNWTWSHTHSNHFYYRYDGHKVFVDIVKRF